MHRLMIAAAAVLACAAPGLAQTCWSGPNGMVMCPDGFMSMGGMWMRLPQPPAGAIVPAPGAPATRWRQSWSVAPDGSRREAWESATQLPDGRIVRDAQTRIVFPDGRVCVQRGPTLACD